MGEEGDTQEEDQAEESDTNSEEEIIIEEPAAQEIEAESVSDNKMLDEAENLLQEAQEKENDEKGISQSSSNQEVLSMKSEISELNNKLVVLEEEKTKALEIQAEQRRQLVESNQAVLSQMTELQKCVERMNREKLSETQRLCILL